MILDAFQIQPNECVDNEILSKQYNREVNMLEHNRRTDDERLTLIEHKIDKLSNDVEDLVAAWKAANFVVGFIKWVGGLSTALVAIYTLIKLKG